MIGFRLLSADCRLGPSKARAAGTRLDVGRAARHARPSKTRRGGGVKKVNMLRIRRLKRVCWHLLFHLETGLSPNE